MQARDAVAAVLSGWEGFPALGLQSKGMQYGLGSSFMNRGLDSLREQLDTAGHGEDTIRLIEETVRGDPQLAGASVCSVSSK
jgi:hypothetical protein